MFSDTLYRFVANDTEESGGIWSVSAGQLEKNIRHYRVFMNCENIKVDIECTINVCSKNDVELEDFVAKLSTACEPISTEAFLLAIQQIFKEDPWLQKAPCKFIS